MRSRESIIGNSSALSAALGHLSQLAPINRPVLILGERGTGKELAAERLHYLSSRWEGPLVKVNCAAMAETLLESDLFGHEAGAFTGAVRAREGRFERANGGTLLLDELGTMSGRLQEKVLRVVEYGEFERLGSQRTLEVDVRVVGATNADLRDMAARGHFRADLLDRLSFDVVHLPPLRHRREDIGELALHFAVQMSAELGWDLFPGFSAKALTTLEDLPWPGNIRELKNTVERSLYRWADPTRAVDSIASDPFGSPYASADPDGALQGGGSAGRRAKAEEAPSEDADVLPMPGFSEQMAELEKQLLLRALHENGNHQGRAADALSLSYDQLRGLLRKHGLRSRRRRGSPREGSDGQSE
ncbi:MAG: phage shock protein operon transcriptional activator [Pseudomonadota bacterium]